MTDPDLPTSYSPTAINLAATIDTYLREHVPADQQSEVWREAVSLVDRLRRKRAGGATE